MATDLELLLADAGRHVPGPSSETEERALRVVLALRPPPRATRRRSVAVPQSILLLLVTALALGALTPLGEESPGGLGRKAASLLAEPGGASPVEATIVSGSAAGALSAHVSASRRPRTLAYTPGPERRGERGKPVRGGRLQTSARAPARVHR
jgi:hypothetical protein